MKTLAIAWVAALLASCGGVPDAPAGLSVIGWTWSPEKVECDGLGEMLPADGAAVCEWACGLYDGAPRHVIATFSSGYYGGSWTHVFAPAVVEETDCH